MLTATSNRARCLTAKRIRYALQRRLEQSRTHPRLNIHADIVNGKIYIQHDGTEDGIATDLEIAGVPKSDIVLAFHAPELRKHTEYAIA